MAKEVGLGFLQHEILSSPSIVLPRCAAFQPDWAQTIPAMISSIVQIIPPPATLGGRSANAAHRLSAFLHSLHLVTGDFHTLRQLLLRLVSITTDLGVEHLLTKLEPFELSCMLPFFQPATPNGAPAPVEDDGFHVQAEGVMDVDGDQQLLVRAAPQAPDDAMVNLQACHGVGGLLHIIHNAFKDLGSCMDGYEEHVSNMSALSKFLTERHSKERLIAKCFCQGLPAEAPFRNAISTFSSQCYRPRWGTVAKCTLDLQHVLPALRYGWDKQKYLDGGDAASAAGEGAVSIDLVDKLVRCVFFESYLVMLRCFAKLTLHLTAWAESCPCHWHLMTGGQAAALGKSARRLLETCPMRCRRAPELAMNDFLQEMAAFSSQGANGLAQHFPLDLANEQRSQIVHDFELGRSYLTAVMSMKTSHFRSLPWSLAGLAHHDREKARELWSKARTEYGDGDTARAEMLRTRLPRLFRPAVLQQGDQWYFGADLSSCPDFAAEVAALALIPIAERRVESQHARTQKGSKKSPNHSPAYMSLQLRSKDLRGELCQDPKGFIARLAPHVNQCRSYRKAAFRMRLLLHPAVCSPARSRNARCRTVRDALYRADMRSQHQQMPPVFVRTPHTQDGRPRPATSSADAATVDSTPLGPVLHQLALEHVVARIRDIQAQTESPADSLIFAVSYEAQAFAFLREFLVPSQEAQPMPMLAFSGEEGCAIVERASSPASEMDVLFQKLSMASSSDQRLTGVFFRLLPSMSRMKRFQGEGERRMSSTDVPIALLRPVSYDPAKKEMLVDSELLSMRSLVQGLSVDDVPCVMSISAMSFMQLQTLGVCKVEPSIVYCLRPFPDLPPELENSMPLRRVLQEICLRGKKGVPDVSGFVAEDRSVLQALQQHGLVTQDMPVKLTDKGLMHVCFAKKVFEPRRLLAALPVPPPEQSKWQLLQSLVDRGWEVRVASPRDCRKAAPFQPASPDAVKVLYLAQQRSGIVCSRLYLLALTMAGEHGRPVPHSGGERVYAQVLQGVDNLALPVPRAAASAAFRAIPDGEQWLDHEPSQPPKQKRRRTSSLRRRLLQLPCLRLPSIMMRRALLGPEIPLLKTQRLLT